MKVIVKETEEKKTLKMYDPKSGLDCFEDLIRNNGSIKKGEFEWCEENDCYVCSQNTYDFWEKFLFEKQGQKNERTM